ncbi:hypothetical protein [Nocardioides stalactiti]|uniref:hypothetical protein n=1 Tax=Nocardioides stalactiti TaxID=2755356 RepID=UPI001603C134|nr:hypothetical protein [Nocardioides stalactiti]
MTGPWAAPPLTRVVVGIPVVEGPVPGPWDAMIRLEDTVWADHDRLLFDAGDAAVHVTAETVTFEARAPGAREQHDWLLYATAARTVLGFRRRFNLHGTLVVSPEGAAVALLGASLAGKSTTTMALLRRGWRFGCDDIVEVTVGADGVVAHPVARPIHLSDTAARSAGADLVLGRDLPGRAKRAYLLDGDLSPRRLAAMVVVGATGEGAVETLAVDPLAALPVVAASADRYGILHLPEHRGPLLRWAADVSRQVPLHEVRRPAGRDTVEAVADAVADLVSG